MVTFVAPTRAAFAGQRCGGSDSASSRSWWLTTGKSAAGAQASTKPWLRPQGGWNTYVRDANGDLKTVSEPNPGGITAPAQRRPGSYGQPGRLFQFN
jgi:hypothetical protein